MRRNNDTYLSSLRSFLFKQTVDLFYQLGQFLRVLLFRCLFGEYHPPFGRFALHSTSIELESYLLCFIMDGKSWQEI